MSYQITRRLDGSLTPSPDEDEFKTYNFSNKCSNKFCKGFEDDQEYYINCKNNKCICESCLFNDFIRNHFRKIRDKKFRKRWF